MVGRSVTEGTRMEGHQLCKFPLVGSGGWTKVEFSTSGKVTSGAGLLFAGVAAGNSLPQLVCDAQKLQGIVPQAQDGPRR